MQANEDNLLSPGKSLRNRLSNFKSFHDPEYAEKLMAEDVKINDKNWLITPELNKSRVLYKVYEFKELIDSSSMTFKNWITIGEIIKKYYHCFEAFLIIHGTDSLEYTAPALSFMLKNLKKTVILTASQIPLSYQKNDAYDNLLGSFKVIGNYDIPEVCVYFRDSLLRGNRIKKIHSSSLDAFKSPNFPPLGIDHIEFEENWNLIKSRDSIVEKFSLHTVISY